MNSSRSQDEFFYLPKPKILAILDKTTLNINLMGKMAWLSSTVGDGTKILFLQPDPTRPFRPYTAFPHLKVPDYRIEGGSRGWATYQKLFKLGWELVASDKVKSRDHKYD